MSLSLKPRQFCRIVSTISRNYSEKSVYERHEEGEKPRTVYGTPYPDWRKPWIKRKGEWKTKLSVFVEKNPSPDILNMMSQIPDLTFEKIKNWWESMKDIQDTHNQKYLPERVAILGSNLAALHFFTYRQCAVRLKGSHHWIIGDAATLNLPSVYQDGYCVEAVDCTNFIHSGIHYEGLQNLSKLQFLKWLTLKNNKHVDVWCLDRIAGQNGKTLEYLDISGCKLDVGCIFAIARMPKLKVLVVTDPGDNVDVQSALSMLEEQRPGLLIRALDN